LGVRPGLKIFVMFLLLVQYHFSSSILLINVPTPCETKTLNSSPCLSVLRGLAFHPTPGGVLLVSVTDTHEEDIPSQDDGTRIKGCTLWQKWDDPGDREDQVTACSAPEFNGDEDSLETHLLDYVSAELSSNGEVADRLDLGCVQ
jgi:hypothetical protein